MIRIIFLKYLVATGYVQDDVKDYKGLERVENFDTSESTVEETIRYTLAKIRFCLSEPMSRVNEACDEIFESRSKLNRDRKGC